MPARDPKTGQFEPGQDAEQQLGVVVGVQVLTLKSGLQFCLTDLRTDGYITGDFVTVLRGRAAFAENLTDAGSSRYWEFQQARSLLSRFEKLVAKIEGELAERYQKEP